MSSNPARAEECTQDHPGQLGETLSKEKIKQKVKAEISLSKICFNCFQLCPCVCLYVWVGAWENGFLWRPDSCALPSENAGNCTWVLYEDMSLASSLFALKHIPLSKTPSRNDELDIAAINCLASGMNV